MVLQNTELQAQHRIGFLSPAAERAPTRSQPKSTSARPTMSRPQAGTNPIRPVARLTQDPDMPTLVEGEGVMLEHDPLDADCGCDACSGSAGPDDGGVRYVCGPLPALPVRRVDSGRVPDVVATADADSGAGHQRHAGVRGRVGRGRHADAGGRTNAKPDVLRCTTPPGTLGRPVPPARLGSRRVLHRRSHAKATRSAGRGSGNKRIGSALLQCLDFHGISERPRRRGIGRLSRTAQRHGDGRGDEPTARRRNPRHADVLRVVRLWSRGAELRLRAAAMSPRRIPRLALY